jgi:dephospho-CoA kinase
MSGPGPGAQARPLRIGLTGPIGCGKSTLARHLASRGGVVIDADDLARAVTVPGAATLPAIRARFGDGVFGVDGALDRAALATVVFVDAGALRDLEAIVHPAVRERVTAALGAAAAAGAAFVVIEAIKLVEGGLASTCDEVWLVVCDPATQRDRLAVRGQDALDSERRIAAQDDLSERLTAVATRVLRTDGPLETALAAADAALDTALEDRPPGTVETSGMGVP